MQLISTFGEMGHNWLNRRLKMGPLTPYMGQQHTGYSAGLHTCYDSGLQYTLVIKGSTVVHYCVDTLCHCLQQMVSREKEIEKI